MIQCASGKFWLGVPTRFHKNATASSRNTSTPWFAKNSISSSMLLKTADTFEQETSLALDRMLAALVPVVTMLMAGIVGVVILAVLTPIYDLTNVIG